MTMLPSWFRGSRALLGGRKSGAINPRTRRRTRDGVLARTHIERLEDRTLLSALDDLPMLFEPNLGQAGDGVDYVARGAGYGLQLSGADLIVSLRDTEASGADDASIWQTVSIGLVGADAASVHTAGDRQRGVTNYYHGESTNWIENVPHFGRVDYEDVYRGIDATFYGTDGKSIEFDYVIEPGADPSAIEFEIGGASSLEQAADGSLIVTAGGAQIALDAPISYQIIDGQRVAVASRFVEHGGNRFGFELGGYDPSHTLIIDPVVSSPYSTYFGGTGPFNSGNSGEDIATDGTGAAYFAGYTNSNSGFPGVTTSPSNVNGSHQGPSGNTGNPGGDAFVAKLSPDGQALEYLTFLGGSQHDYATGIAVSAAGQAFVTGSTRSLHTTDTSLFPTTADAFRTTPVDMVDQTANNTEAFVVRLNANGTIGYSTFMGARNTVGNDIALDPANNDIVYLTGLTAHLISFDAAILGPQTDFPPFGTANAFLQKLDTTPSGPGEPLLYSTLLAGGSTDIGTAIAVVDAQNVFVVGDTAGRFTHTATSQTNSLPIFTGTFDTGGFDGSPTLVYGSDGFVVKLDTTVSGDASLKKGAYFAAADSENTADVAVDRQGRPWLVGSTIGNHALYFPYRGTTFTNVTANPTGYVGYIARAAADLSVLEYAAIFGTANPVVNLNAVAVDAFDRVYVTGYGGQNVPITANAYDRMLGGNEAYVVIIDPSLPSADQILLSSFLGGTSGSEVGTGIATDGKFVYVTGQSTSQFSQFYENFYSANPAYYSGSSKFPVSNAIQNDRGAITSPNAFVFKGLVPSPPSISGHKFHDVDGNGVFDAGAGDSLLNGWTIELVDALGGVVATTTTGLDLDSSGTVEADEQGYYEFVSPPSGSLTVREILQAGWQISTPVNGEHSVTFAGSSLTDKDFGNFIPGSLHGFKFHDIDGDGQRTLKRFPDQVHQLDEDCTVQAAIFGQRQQAQSFTAGISGTLAQVDATLKTHGNFGDLTFSIFAAASGIPTGAALGSVTIAAADLPPEHVVTVVSVDFTSQSVNLTRGTQYVLVLSSPNSTGAGDGICWLGDSLTNYAGGGALISTDGGTNWQTYVPATDLWFATHVTALEQPQPGVTINVAGTDGRGNSITRGPVTTNADGEFWFEDLPPGTYTVTETVPAGSIATRTTSRNVTIKSGEELVWQSGAAMLDPSDLQHEVLVGDTLIFANSQFASIAGLKFEDVNGNGQRDLGEAALAGWEIALLDANGNAVLDSNGDAILTETLADDPNTMTIDETGTFLLSNLRPGQYRVAETLQADWVQTFPFGSTGKLYHEVTVSSGQQLTGLLFGNAVAAVSTSTTVSASPASPASFGQVVTFTATVTPASGSAVPTGSVTFTVDGVAGNSIALNQSGAASFTTSQLGLGSHTIKATYTSDGATFTGSESANLNYSIEPIATTTFVTANPDFVLFSQSVTFTALVRPVTGSAVPTGSVEFFVDGVGQAPVNLDAAGAARFTTSQLSAGPHRISARYIPETYNITTNFVASFSPNFAYVVNPTLQISNASIIEGTSGTTNALFTVSLSSAISQDVTVNFVTISGTAVVGSDFSHGSGTLTIPAGAMARTISVPVLGDTTIEPDETFSVHLSSAVGATILNGQGLGTILNDDSQPVGDTDNDGVGAATEDAAPNGGDGNNDGTPDREQANVTSLPSGNGSSVTLAAPAGTKLEQIQITNTLPPGAPQGVQFPLGLFNFGVTNVPTGGATTVTIFPQSNVLPTTYYKFGPEPQNPATVADETIPHWYEFLFDGSTGAEILSDRIVLHLLDGGRGDSDIAANGVIVDPSGPGAAAAPTNPGNVQVTLRRGKLIVIGDNGDNGVRIEPAARLFSLRVIGTGGTTLNGRTAPLNFAGVRKGITALMGDGKDQLVLGGSATRQMQSGLVQFDTGSGDDLLRIQNVSMGNSIQLTTNDGNDSISLEYSTFRSEVRLVTGAGIDTLTIRDVQFVRAFVNDLDSNDIQPALIDAALATWGRPRRSRSR